jgi:hypothetical protein
VAVAHPSSLGTEVLSALGLKTDRCASLTIEFKPDSLVLVTAVYHTDSQELNTVLSVFKDRKLEPSDAPDR